VGFKDQLEIAESGISSAAVTARMEEAGSEESDPCPVWDDDRTAKTLEVSGLVHVSSLSLALLVRMA
jgi:hypothetical protein